MNAEVNKIESFTLEDIAERKAALKDKIKVQNEAIADICHDLFVPVEPSTKAEVLMHAVNSGISIFDGVMFGMKAIRRMRSVMRFFKKR